MRAGAGNRTVFGCLGCAGGKPCREGVWPCREGVKPYLEGVGSCGEGGGDPKWFYPLGGLCGDHILMRTAVVFGLHQDFSGPFLAENVQKVSIGDIHQHGT